MILAVAINTNPNHLFMFVYLSNNNKELNITAIINEEIDVYNSSLRFERCTINVCYMKEEHAIRMNEIGAHISIFIIAFNN